MGRGTDYRRDDGTDVVIFNVQAFASAADTKQAIAHWALGKKKEDAGDIQGAQQHFKDALNMMMSFSVRKENAADYAAGIEVTCIVEEVETKDRNTMVDGKPNPNFGKPNGTTLGLNRVRPVRIEKNGKSAADFFAELEEDAALDPDSIPAETVAGATAQQGAPATTTRRTRA